MPFETFLTNCQKMFNIYEQEGEPMPEGAKIRFLFKKVQHTGLQMAIASLEASQTNGAQLTYTRAANHLSQKVSTLPEYIYKNRNISAVGTSVSSMSSGGGDATIHNAVGSINTVYITHWRSLSKEQRNLVHTERKRLGISGGKQSKGSPSNKAQANRTKQLVAQNKKHKRKIKALERKLTKSSIDDADDGGDESDDPDTDAGDAFGGKRSKKKGKK